MGALYLVTSPSGKQYIGVTVRSLGERMARHWRDAVAGSQCALHRAAMKHGIANMRADVLVEADCPKYLRLLERRAIAVFGTKAPAGYNLTDGGDGATGRKATDESRARMSVAQSLTWADEATRNKRSRGISRARVALWADPEVRAEMIAARQSADYKATMAEHLSDRWATRRDNMLKGIKARWTDSEQRKQHAEIAKSTWADPEVRARRIAAMKEAHARRRAAAKD